MVVNILLRHHVRYSRYSRFRRFFRVYSEFASSSFPSSRVATKVCVVAQRDFHNISRRFFNHFSNSKIGRDISVQVAGFIGAIRRGIKASQLGFTTGEDLIALSSMVQSSTRAESAEYLMGTLQTREKRPNKLSRTSGGRYLP